MVTMDDAITIDIGPAVVNLQIYRDAEFRYAFGLQDENGDPISMTGTTLVGKVVTADDGTLVTDLSPDWTTASDGEGEIVLTASQTANITAGNYVWNLRFVDGNETKGPIMEGIVKVKGKRDA